jgi:myo-inositol 2-dehydrogenase/D-chiro-inositol 1-dehydrogenase
MVRIAVLGCGRIGRMHADNIAAHGKASLAGVFDVVASASKDVADKHGTKIFSSAEEAISSSDVDAVLIATTTATHADLLEKAVAAGKPILCEKPIDLSLDRVNACAKAIGGTKVPIMLGFVRRFDTGHRAVHDAIKAGEIGELHQVIITSRDPGMPPVAYAEGSGGIYRDMTIHDFDMARFILGDEVTEVTATGSRLVAPELMQRLGDYDSVSVVLKTASGKQCIINNSRQAVYGYDQRVEALGNAGMAISENKPMNMATLYKADYTGRGAPLMNFFIDRYLDAFMAEIGAFVDAVESGSTPEVGFEDGRLALVLAEAAIKSTNEKRTVKVSEIG